ncbi:MAG: formate dehydrogenase subunit gamma [Steroidobacteraceae bacterium]
MQQLDPKELEQVNGIVARLAARPGPLIEILHEVQAALGCIPTAAVAVIADGLNLSRAEVHGVVSFYHFFREHRGGRHTLEVCRAEACQSMHSEGLIDHLKQRLNVDFHGTTADGKVSLLPVYCLGNCACAPSVMIDGELHGRVTPQRADELLSELT